MNEAIHKPSGKRVSAYKIQNGLEWQGKDKDEFKAPTDLIDGWDDLLLKGIQEVKVVFVRKHKRNERLDKEETVREHFRIETEGVVESYWASESEEHKLAKKYIYDNWDKISVILNKKEILLSSLDIEDIRIERGIGQKRADVLITFNKFDEVLGNGIAFEIQISPQNKEETVERSYDRSVYGYSVVWIWSNDLKGFNNKCVVLPFNEAIKEFNINATNNQDKRLSEIADKADKFITEQSNRIMLLIQKNEKIYQDIKEFKFNTENEIQIFDRQSKDFSKSISDYYNKKLEEIHLEIGNKLDKVIESLDLKSLVESMIQGKTKNIVDRDKMPCSYCNSTDTHEYLDCYMCWSCKKRTKKEAWVMKDGVPVKV